MDLQNLPKRQITPPTAPQAKAAIGGDIGLSGAVAHEPQLPTNPLASLPEVLPAQRRNSGSPGQEEQHKPKNPHALEETKKGGLTLAGSAVGSVASSKAGHKGTGISWVDGQAPDMSRAHKPAEQDGFNIQSVAAPGGKIIVTSNNIRMEVAPMSAEFDRMFKGKSNEQVQQLIDQWQSKKNADDRLGYGNLDRVGGGKVRGSEDLRQLARRDGYYGSEQHMVWAHAASARTGGRMPPEFFLDFDPFGGTAGNGPVIEQGGNAREPMSTISMAHDTDWSLGRYMGVGPLAQLDSLQPTERYQMKRMGMAGLFNGDEAVAFNQARPVNPFDETDRQRGAEDEAIFSAVQNASGREQLYRGWSPNVLGDENYKINSNLRDWRVQFRPEYQRNVRGPTDDATAFSEAETFRGPGVEGSTLGWLNEHHSPGH